MDDEKLNNELSSAFTPTRRQDIDKPFSLDYKGEPIAMVLPFDEYLHMWGLAQRGLFADGMQQHARHKSEGEKEVAFCVEEHAEGRGWFAEAQGYLIVVEGNTYEEIKEAIQDSVRCHFAESERPARIRLDVIHHEVLPV